MRQAIPPQTPQQWFAHLFNAKSARDGGVVRRRTRDVDRMVGRDRFLSEISRRGFSAVQNGNQIVVFCNAQPVRLLTSGAQTFRESLQANPYQDLHTGIR